MLQTLVTKFLSKEIGPKSTKKVTLHVNVFKINFFISYFCNELSLNYRNQQDILIFVKPIKSLFKAISPLLQA
jgi:hypothetical protein